MGCCQSSLTPMERTTFENILTNIPVHCQQEIINLPTQKFLKAYVNHLTALNHFQRAEYLAAISSECQAIQDLELLLCHHKDHFIFAQMHKLLSACLWEIAHMKQASTEAQIALNIMLKHTPTNYLEISLQYFRVAFFSLIGKEWKKAERCFMKTIETARLTNELDQEYIRKMEEFLESTRQQINGSPIRIIPIQFTSNPGESRENLIRRATTETGVIGDQMGTFQVDGAELKRLPDKQTESQINDDILNDVLKNLETFLKENVFLCKFGTKGGSIYFLAAYFKSTQMKLSSLSPDMVEAALTIIINRTNDGNTVDGERYAGVKQSPFTISYTDDDESNMAGVRVFRVTGKKQI